MAKRPLNLKPDPADKRDFPLVKLQATRPLDPAGLSVLSWKDQMTPIKDQGRKGSCVGFATAAMKEWQEQAEHLKEVAEGKVDHRQGKVYDYSEQWIYHQAKKIDAWPGEEGTSIRDAMKVLNHLGCPPEAGWPYDDVLTGEPESWAHMVAQWARIGSYYRVVGSDQLVQALNYGPVVVGVGVFKEFFSPGPEGLIAMPANPNELYGGHAICIVGYDFTKRLFEFKNSWSKAWGNAGYGKLHFNYIDQYMWDAWVAVDMSVEKIEKGDIPEIEEFKAETPKVTTKRVAPTVKPKGPFSMRVGRRLIPIRK